MIHNKNYFQILNFLTACILIGMISCTDTGQEKRNGQKNYKEILAVNENSIARGEQTIAIVGATLIDGMGGEPLSESVVIINGNNIESVGSNESIEIPEEAQIFDATGLSLLPGLIDAHYHGDSPEISTRFLQHGVTSIRDPGAWIEDYEDVRNTKQPIPRLFLTGPHLDMFPPAYPRNSSIVRDVVEARNQVQFFVKQGASAIKVYFRTSPEIMQAICSTAQELGVPTTAHLEIAFAREAIEAGIDGIEHVTSFGIDLVPRHRAEQYRQSVLADNNARRNGRYEMWSEIDLHSSQAEELIQLIVREQIYVSPTLAIFEYRLGKENTDTLKHKGFEKMMAFVGQVKKAGAFVVVGSHTWVPYADIGWAYQREMELLAESGLSNSEIIVAATMENARFFRVEDQLGSVEPGKQADLILVKGNPLEDIKAMYNIEKVMLNGVWVAPVTP